LPVGARYVVEGRGGKDGEFRIFSRYVVLPGGRRINVPLDSAAARATAVSHTRGNRSAHRGRASQANSTKIFERIGTTQRQQH
jgi:hypothetical protein